MTYADPIRQVVFNPGTAAELIDGLVSEAYSASMYAGSSPNSITGGPALMPLSEVTFEVASNEAVFIVWSFTYSISASGFAIWKLYINGVQAFDNILYQQHAAGFAATGYDRNATITFLSMPAPGTHTYSLYWLGGNATVYSRFGRVDAFKFKKQ